MHRIATTIIAVTALVAGCGSGDDDGDDDPVVSSEIPACESFDGQETLEVANWFNDGNPCARDIGLDTPETSFVGIGSRDCADGTTLWWNDVGWGPSDGTWTFEDDDGLPPDTVLDACTAG